MRPVVHVRPKAAGVALALILLASPARAEHDQGEYATMLRFSPDGQRLLAGRCDMDTDTGVLEVRSAGSELLDRLSFGRDGLAAGGLTCAPEVFERLAGGIPEVAALVARHGVTERPHRGGLSSDGTRYVGVEDEKPGLITLFLYDAEGYRKLKYAPALLNELGTNAYAVSVAWAPADAYAVVTGSRAIAEHQDTRRWEGLTMRVDQPSRRPDKRVDRPSLAKKLNGFGYKAYKRGDYLRATVRYAEAVALDPTYATAVYNLACMKAINADRDEALAGLRRLASLGTAEAREKLQKAPRDPDFRDLVHDPDFRALTGR
jgi:tetratricopeptide (TPR) repeat protein